MSFDAGQIVGCQHAAEEIMAVDPVATRPLHEQHARRADALAGMQDEVSGLLADLENDGSGATTFGLNAPLSGRADAADHSSFRPLHVEEVR